MDPIVVLGPPASLCPVPVVLTVRRLASQRSCLDFRQGDGRNESPVNGAGGREGDLRVDKTAKDQQTGGQTYGQGKGRHGAMTDTLWSRWVGPSQGSTSPPPPSISHAHPKSQKAMAPLGAGPGTALTTALKGGRPRKTDAGDRGGMGIYGETPSRPLPLT